jgi:periplasmic divalent cation tolerance protein
MSDFVMVTTTTDSLDEARRLSAAAVEARFAACAQLSAPVTSTYWWQGQVETATEYRIEFKTRGPLAGPLLEFLKELHSYETPELLVTPIVTGHQDYLDWINAETRASDEGAG